MLTKELEESTLAQEQGLYSELISSRTGVLTRLGSAELQEIPGTYFAAATTSDKKVLFDLDEPMSEFGAGFSVTRRDAELKAVGEAIERYCFEYHDSAELTRGTAREIPTAHRLPKYDRSQYETLPYERLTEDEETYWTDVTRVLGDESLAVPAFYVFTNIENDYCEVSSTGTACHVTLTKALLNAVLEIVERDHAMIRFLHQETVPILHEEVIERVAPEHRRIVERAGLELTTLDLTLDAGIPVYFSILTDGQRLGIGAACEPYADETVRGSIEEALMTYFNMSSIIDTGGGEGMERAEISSLLDHLLYYQGGNQELLLDRAAEEPRTDLQDDLVARSADEQTQLRAATSAVEEAGLSMWYRETTTADVRNAGLRTVRVVSPEAVDLNVTYPARPRGRERLADPPEIDGRPLDDLIDRPHPVP